MITEAAFKGGPCGRIEEVAALSPHPSFPLWEAKNLINTQIFTLTDTIHKILDPPCRKDRVRLSYKYFRALSLTSQGNRNCL